LLISSGVSILWGVEICLFPWELKVADKTIWTTVQMWFRLRLNFLLEFA